MSGWKKVKPADSWDFEENPEMVGIYVGKEVGVGPNNSNLYSFKTPDGKIVPVWGSSILDSRLKNLEIGVEVKIAYLGKEVSEKTGREYHNYDVFFRLMDEDVPPEEVVVEPEKTPKRSVGVKGAKRSKRG